jgi:hypothetical protein
MKKPPLKPGDTHPAHVLRDEYGMNAANRPTIIVNNDEVPEALRPLIPYAERWAIPCDVTRGDYFDQQSEEDIAAFWHDLLPHVEAINRWIAAQPQEVSAWPEAAVHFLYLLKAHDEAYQPTQEEKQALQKRGDAWAHEQSRKRAIEKAMTAFQVKDYAAIVELLAPFESELEKVTRAKLDFARKKLGGGKG